jgi:hypothetical protein
MRLTQFAYSQIDEPAKVDELAKASEPVKVDEPVCYEPPQWARRSTKGFAGADFALQPDGTLRCPADQPLYPQERRAERDGSLRVLYAARIGHCRSCPLRTQCQEHGSPIKPRRVSAVFWPRTSTTSPPDEPLSHHPVPSHPVLWGDWERCHLRRHCSICCARKPFYSPLAQFSTWQQRMFPYRMCLLVPNEPIGGSVGSNVSLAMLVSLPPHPLRSPFMVSRSALLKYLALMW